MTEDQTYSPKDVATILGLSEEWVKRQVRTGKIKGFMIATKYRIPRRELIKFEESKHDELIDNVKGRRGCFGRTFGREKLSAG